MLRPLATGDVSWVLGARPKSELPKCVKLVLVEGLRVFEEPLCDSLQSSQGSWIMMSVVTVQQVRACRSCYKFSLLCTLC